MWIWNYFLGLLFFQSTYFFQFDFHVFIGRLYDGHIFDMFEIGMENFKSIADFSVGNMNNTCFI